MLRRVFGIGIIILLLGAPACPAMAAATVPEIEIAGLATISAEAVRARVKMPAGATDEALDTALKSIMSTGFFSDVRIDRRGRKLVVTVVENPIIAAVTISGTSANDKKDIEPAIQSKARGRYTASRLHADAIRIRDIYRRKGRLGTKVTPTMAKQTDGRVELTFAIKEGAVSKIDRITFAGNQAFTDAQLRDVVTTSESSWLDILKMAAFYDPERIEGDRELIRRHYASHGYPEGHVTDVAADLDAQGTGYVVKFTVEEGERHVFGRPQIDSKIDGVSASTFEPSLKVQPGAPYNRDSIDHSVEAMTEMLSRQGQPFARVSAVPHVDSASRRVDLVFRIEAGKPLYVERIDITGNRYTKDYVIRRELAVAEGDPINTVLIEHARTRIKALGFFTSVEMKIDAGSAPDRAHLTVAVVEAETAGISFGVGYSAAEGVIGDISWTERNLLGNGQYLQVKLSGSATRLQANLDFTEPHLLGSNLSGGFDLIYKDTDYTQQASYMNRRYGGDLRIGMPVTDQFSTSANYTFVRSTLYNVGPAASLAIREAIPGYPVATSSSYNTSSVGTGATYDTRDNKKRPTSGVYVTTSQDFAGVGGDVRYLRSVTDARAYYALADGVTVMGRATGGVISGWGGQDVRLLDLFYKGNDIVRGFAVAGIGPRDLASANQDALGGRMYAATTAETIFQLPGVPKDVGLSGAVFTDAGSLWGANRTAAALPGVAGNAASLRVSAGVGIAWDSPLGSMRADYAIPLVKQGYDKTQPFSFGLNPF